MAEQERWQVSGSAAAGETMAAPCGFGDPEALRELFVKAGHVSGGAG